MLINLKILLPFQIFVERKGVKRIVAQTIEGFVWALAPSTRLHGGPGAGNSHL